MSCSVQGVIESRHEVIQMVFLSVVLQVLAYFNNPVVILHFRIPRLVCTQPEGFRVNDW